MTLTIALAIAAVAAAFDVRTGRIPNAITYPAIALGLAFAGFPLVLDVLLCTLACGTVLSVAVLWSRARLGETLRQMAVVGGVLAAAKQSSFVPAMDVHIPLGVAIFAGLTLVVFAPAVRVLSGAF